MATVLRVPTAPVRDWPYWESGIREVLGEAKIPAEMVEEITRRMQEVHRQYSDFKFPSQVTVPFLDGMPQDQQDAVSSAVTGFMDETGSRIRDFSHRVILDRLVLEIRLYGFRHPESRACVDELLQTTR